MAKIQRSKRPKLTYREIENQIFLRTGIPREMVRAVINNYGEIIEEALIGQVEVPFCKLGYFTIKQMQPKRMRQSIPNTHNYGEMIDLDGYQKTIFRTNTVWAGRQKQATLWRMGEENPMLELFDWDDGMDNDEDVESDEIDDDEVEEYGADE